MKPARILLVLLGLAVAVGVVGLAVARIPAVQRWAVLKAIGPQPGFNLKLERISAGFSHLELAGVAWEKGGLHVKLERLEATYALLPMLFNHRADIRQLWVTGLEVDTSHLAAARTQTAAVAGAPVVVPGLLTQVQLPFDLLLGEVRLDGRAFLAGAPGQPAIAMNFTATGGGFAPGQEGNLVLVSELKNPAAGARVEILNARISLVATQAAGRNFSHAGLTAVVDATGKSFSDQNRLKVSAELARSATGENYSCTVDTLRGGVAARVLGLTAGLPAGKSDYAGEWTLKAQTAQLEPFFLGGALPEFKVQGGGRFAFNPATRAVALSGQLAADVSKLEMIEPAWRAIGAVRLESQFNLTGDDEIFRLQELAVKLDGTAPVLQLQASQAAEFNLKQRRLQVGGAKPGEVLRLKIIGLPLAWVRPFVEAVDVSGGMITGEYAVVAEGDGLAVRPVAPLRVDALSVVRYGELLLDRAALEMDAGATWSENDLRATVAGLRLTTPAGDTITARGDVSQPGAAGSPMVVRGSYTADLPGLAAPWLPLGHVKSSGEADFSLGGENLDVRRVNLSLAGAAGGLLVKTESLRPFHLELAGLQATATDGGADLLRIVLGRIPLEAINLNQPGSRLGGQVEQGEFILTSDAGKLNLRATVPLKLANLSLTQDGRVALAGLSMDANPGLEIAGSSLKGRTGDVVVHSTNGTTLVGFSGEATRTQETGLRGSLTFNLDVPGLATQPLFRGTQAVSQGHASGEVRVALGASSQAEARLTLNGLVARDGGRALPVANLSFRAIIDPDGKLAVQMPVLLDNAGRRSDMNFSLELVPAGTSFGLDGKLTGDHVEIADVATLAGIFMVSTAPGDKSPGPGAAPAAIVADTRPSWAKFTGRLALDVKSVTYGTDWTMTGLTGRVTVDPARISLEKCVASFGEKSSFSAQGNLKFIQGARPYQLGADFSLTEFDAGKLFKAIEPGKPPTVEGIFSMNGHLEGTGETLERTVQLTRGRFELTSRQGVFRGLQRTSSKVSLTSKAVELGASVLGSLLGSQTATKTAEKVAGAAYFADQLAQALAELNYDQLNVRLVRDESLNMNLEDFSLVSPEIRLLGKGMVTYVADKALLEQPLSASLAMAGRGKIEQLLGKLRLLDGNRDELGYAKTNQPVTLAGTLAKPDPTAFFTKIAASKLTDFLLPGN